MNYNEPNGKEEENKYPPMEKSNIKASIKKQSAVKKFLDNFIRRDFATMRDEFVNEWLIPQLQGMVIDGVNTWLQSMFDDRAITISKTIGKKKKNTDYNGISSNRSSGITVSTKNGKSIYNVPEIFVLNKADATKAVADAQKYLLDYNAVPVDIFLDSLSITCDWADTKWGFKNLDDVTIKPGRDDDGNSGWIITLPEPEYLAK